MGMSKLPRHIRILFQAAAITAMLAGPAAAQSLSPFQAAPKRQLTEEEIEQQKKLDADYKSTIKKLPDQKVVDPWGAVRQAPVKTTKSKQP
jgi:uncharacterized protein YnzC (UPF0291/DUF896 family)